MMKIVCVIVMLVILVAYIAVKAKQENTVKDELNKPDSNAISHKEEDLGKIVIEEPEKPSAPEVNEAAPEPQKKPAAKRRRTKKQTKE